MPRPSEDSALILPVALPRRLEVLRRRAVRAAAVGLPAHVTLLYPFVAPDDVDDGILERIAAVVSSHRIFRFRLAERREWPTSVVYAAVEPESPFRALFDDLAAAFPDHPLYGGGVPFVPHVTVVEGDAGLADDARADPGWDALPVERTAAAIELIVRKGGRWSAEHRFALAGATT